MELVSWMGETGSSGSTGLGDSDPGRAPGIRTPESVSGVSDDATGTEDSDDTSGAAASDDVS
jgi:hypothetical protein